MEVIKEEKMWLENNECVTKKGVFKMRDGSYLWMTLTRSGYCKTVSEAFKKAGF